MPRDVDEIAFLISIGLTVMLVGGLIAMQIQLLRGK